MSLNPPLLLLLIVLRRSDYDEAAKHCQSALRGKCTDVEAMSDLAALLGRNGRSGKAIQRWDRWERERALMMVYTLGDSE